MRKLIAVAVVLILVSAANYLPWPEGDGYFDRSIRCQPGHRERELRMSDAVDDESPCPRLLPAPHTYSNQNNCAVKCDPATIVARLVERGEARTAAIRQTLALLLKSAPRRSS